jgi:KUP system potassium uptake protein
MGALVLLNPETAKNPFFAMVPSGAPTYALVALATAATIIASQALITGAFSLTHQAVQLGYFPRVLVKHTSHETEGQIYVPVINWLLASACLLLVVSFRESSRLAAAYGIAVTGTMAITSVIFFVVTRSTWNWPLSRALPLLLFFLAFDIPFFAANVTKVLDGGWVPLAIGAGFFVVMFVWNHGRRLLADFLSTKSRPFDEFLASSKLETRTSGTAVFMTPRNDAVPPTLVHHAERVRVLPKTVILLGVVTERVPFVPTKNRVDWERLDGGFFRMTARYGFMESPDVPRLLRLAERRGFDADITDVTYFIGRETILALPGGKMGALEEHFFAILARNARHAGLYFKLPPDQVVEIGVQVDL